jgi:hypothetical protein
MRSETYIIQGMKYNDQSKSIEVWGHTAENKVLDLEYNGRHRTSRPINGGSDISRPEGKA